MGCEGESLAVKTATLWMAAYNLSSRMGNIATSYGSHWMPSNQIFLLRIPRS